MAGNKLAHVHPVGGIRDPRGEIRRRQRLSAASQRYDAAQDIADECGNPASAIDAIRECLLEHIVSYQEQETRDKDLEAQQDMAFWAKLMFYATVIGAPISIAGLGLLLASLAQTRTALRDTREIGEAQVRAYVSIPGCSVTVAVEPDVVIWHYEMTLSNSGQSPARDVKTQMDEWSSDPYQELKVGDLNAGETRPERVMLSTEADRLEFSDENDTTVRLRPKVHVRFADVFGRETTITDSFTGQVRVVDREEAQLRRVNRKSVHVTGRWETKGGAQADKG